MPLARQSAFSVPPVSMPTKQTDRAFLQSCRTSTLLELHWLAHEGLLAAAAKTCKLELRQPFQRTSERPECPRRSLTRAVALPKRGMKLERHTNARFWGPQVSGFSLARTVTGAEEQRRPARLGGLCTSKFLHSRGRTLDVALGAGIRPSQGNYGWPLLAPYACPDG